MNDQNADKPKIIIDEDWKSHVQAERAALAKEHVPQPDAPSAEPAAQPEEMPIPEASFSVLVTTVATQAMVALGQAPMPGEDKVTVNLPFAKHCIDTLDILAQKTKGNLTGPEDSLLSRFLYELRMLYVAVQNQLSKQQAAPDTKS
jgi:hypothetical protein